MKKYAAGSNEGHIVRRNKGNISKILGKKRKLSIEMIRNLHDKLNISYDILMKGYDLETA